MTNGEHLNGQAVQSVQLDGTEFVAVPVDELLALFNRVAKLEEAVELLHTRTATLEAERDAGG